MTRPFQTQADSIRPPRISGPAHRLTPAQRRHVLKAVVLREKLTNKALGRKLGVSVSTLQRMIRRHEFAAAVTGELQRFWAAQKPAPRPRFGRPRALTPEQEQRVAAVIGATPSRRRGPAYKRLSREMGVSIMTLTRAFTGDNRRRLEQVADAFHGKHQKCSKTNHIDNSEGLSP